MQTEDINAAKVALCVMLSALILNEWFVLSFPVHLTVAMDVPNATLNAHWKKDITLPQRRIMTILKIYLSLEQEYPLPKMK